MIVGPIKLEVEVAATRDDLGLFEVSMRLTDVQANRVIAIGRVEPRELLASSVFDVAFESMKNAIVAAWRKAEG